MNIVLVFENQRVLFQITWFWKLISSMMAQPEHLLSVHTLYGYFMRYKVSTNN